MTAPKDVSVDEARELLDQGYVYIDVRSEPEFEQGHVPGALNVPISHRTEQGMAPNAEFLQVMQAAFGKDERLLLACKAGGRAVKAATQLAQAGFSELVVMGAGFDGSRDAFGRPVPGWSQKGLPVEPGAPPGQAYTDVKARKPGS
jgi:rhodanese-related sulfurtransferase